jgi:predicted peptidase
MWLRKHRWVWFAVVVIALALLAGCAKKRQTPLPAPAPSAPVPSTPVPKPEAGVAAMPEPSATEKAFAYPSGCEPAAVAPWKQCIHVSETGERLSYFLYLPDLAAEAKLPIVTVLHGSSGSGPGDGKALDGGHRFATQLWVSDEVQAQHPSIVLVPQADPPPGETWVRAWRAPSAQDRHPKEALVLVMEVLAALQRNYPADPRRLYLTGQSMGGFGAWLAYTRYPGVFAAIVPVCGGGDPAAVVPNATAVWAFHGDRDTVVPVGRAREMVAAIEAVGAPIRYTEYPGRDHNIFAEAYGEPELADWLFSQGLRAKPNP